MWVIYSANRANLSKWYYHTKQDDYRWNFLFADGHVQFMSIAPGVDNTSTYQMENY